MSNVSEQRKRMLNAGDVFAGLGSIKNKDHRSKIEAERHNKWMDMQGSVKVSPVEWSKAYMKGRQKDDVLRYLDHIIKEYGSVDHPLATPYYESKNAKKTHAFYKNARGYINNHY